MLFIRSLVMIGEALLALGERDDESDEPTELSLTLCC